MNFDLQRILVMYSTSLLEMLIDRHEMTEIQYISSRNNQKCAWTKMQQCVITSIIHTNTKYVTFNSASNFVPGEV